MTPKIATCCYCGTRAALSLRGRERHELSCSNCGAPLHEMKMLRADVSRDRDRDRDGGRSSKRYQSYGRPKRPRKKQKSLAQRFMGEAWDLAEDLFDEIFD